jgi:hypothetical protein
MNKKYDAFDLENPETYKNDPDLNYYCRRVLWRGLNGPIGQSKQKLLSGALADYVLKKISTTEYAEFCNWRERARTEPVPKNYLVILKIQEYEDINTSKHLCNRMMRECGTSTAIFEFETEAEALEYQKIRLSDCQDNFDEGDYVVSCKRRDEL